jgi:excinuclease ABC subunit B
MEAITMNEDKKELVENEMEKVAGGRLHHRSPEKDLSDEDREKLIASLTSEMKKAAKDLDFERAAELRDVIIGLKTKVQ